MVIEREEEMYYDKDDGIYKEYLKHKLAHVRNVKSFIFTYFKQ